MYLSHKLNATKLGLALPLYTREGKLYVRDADVNNTHPQHPQTQRVQGHLSQRAFIISLTAYNSPSQE